MRWSLFLLAGLVGLEAAYLWMELSGLGFPDGYRTDLDRFREQTYPIFITVFALLALTGVFAGRRPSTRPWHSKFVVLLLLILIGNAVYVLVDFYAVNSFEHGQGG